MHGRLGPCRHDKIRDLCTQVICGSGVLYMASGDPHVLVNLGLASQCHKTLNRGAFQQNAVNGDFTTLVPVQMWTCAPANGTVKKAARTKKVAVK